LRHIDLRKASVARADTIRDINRQIILNYVRERGPISRAEISHQTALQRSTISHIINELETLGLVEEFEGPSTGGRPPRLLRLRTKGPVAIGVDLGTQRTVVASSDLAGRVLDRESFTTNSDSDKTLKRIIDCCRKLMRKKDARIEGIGISLPGLVDHESGIVHFIPHFKWRRWPVAEKVRRATGVPVTVDNDANAASLAELWFGLPEIRDSRDFIMVLVEEGLGTGVVFDGQVYHGEAGAAGEFGHTTIGTGAPTTCAGGSRECWEAFASERAALARYKILKADSADQTSFDQLVKQALEGDQVASEALLETAHYIGVGIANLLAGLSPSTVIVGGIIARAWPLIADRLKKAVEANSICRGLPSARIVASTLGDNPQLMGALSLVLALKFSSNDIS